MGFFDDIHLIAVSLEQSAAQLKAIVPVLTDMAGDIKRIADKLVPPPPDIVGIGVKPGPETTH